MEIVPASERVIRFTNLALVHDLKSERIVNSADGGIEIYYIRKEAVQFRFASVDMAEDGKVYLLLSNRSDGSAPIGATLNFSEEMMEPLIHRIKNFLQNGHE